jgi:hypothetical protein
LASWFLNLVVGIMCNDFKYNSCYNLPLVLGNNTAPTSTVFTVGNNAEQIKWRDYIAYCFRSVKGFQKLDLTQVMEVQMEHLFIQDLNQLGL